MLNHHFLSSPGDFPRASLPRTTPVDSSPGDLSPQPSPRESESPTNCLPRLRETPYDTRLPCFYSTIRCHLYYPERAGIPK